MSQKLIIVDLERELRSKAFNYLSTLGKCETLLSCAFLVESELSINSLLASLLIEIGCFDDSSVYATELSSPLIRYSFQVNSHFSHSLKSVG